MDVCGTWVNITSKYSVTRYSAPAFNIIPPIKHINFGPKKHFHSFLYVGKSENLDIKYNFDQSLKMC